jgi:hypothetical protein
MAGAFTMQVEHFLLPFGRVKAQISHIGTPQPEQVYTASTLV